VSVERRCSVLAVSASSIGFIWADAESAAPPEDHAAAPSPMRKGSRCAAHVGVEVDVEVEVEVEVGVIGFCYHIDAVYRLALPVFWT
jgi:hypothetical protein